MQILYKKIFQLFFFVCFILIRPFTDKNSAKINRFINLIVQWRNIQKWSAFFHWQFFRMLEHNEIQYIEEMTFRNLSSLTYLWVIFIVHQLNVWDAFVHTYCAHIGIVRSLRENKLTRLHPKSFWTLTQLQELYEFFHFICLVKNVNQVISDSNDLLNRLFFSCEPLGICPIMNSQLFRHGSLLRTFN